MYPRCFRLADYLPVLLLFVPLWSLGQSINSSISGVVTDPSGSVIPQCHLHPEIYRDGGSSKVHHQFRWHLPVRKLATGCLRSRGYRTGIRDLRSKGDLA
jgi:hypothetical protein